MTTFSQLIDDVTAEMLRPDLRTALVSYVNQTIRELHFKPGQNSPVRFDANRYEEEVDITSDGTWSWTIPSATRFQDVEALFINEVGIYVEPKNPRIAFERNFTPYEDIYRYRSGPVICVAGVAEGWTGKISYFMFPRTLLYKPTTPTNTRVVQFNADTDSYVLIAGGGVPTEEQLELETHWMLQRWGETIKEGARAKAYKRLGDEGRARMCFSSFESMKASVWQSEPSS